MGKQDQRQQEQMLHEFGRSLERMLRDEADRLPDWLERTDCVRAQIRLTEHDHATILALSLEDIQEHAKELISLVEGAFDWQELSIERIGQVLDLIKGALEGELIDQALGIVDTILTRAIESWELSSLVGPYALGTIGKCPSEHDAPIRSAIWRGLPLSVVRRLVEGVLIHSGNS